MPVRIVTSGGDPVRIVTNGGDPIRIVTGNASDPVRVIGDCGIAPTYTSGEVGNVADTTVVVTFSSDITAPCGDYALGFTIYVNGVADAITAAVLSASNTISFTVATAVVNGDAVTISYDSATGCITESCGVTDLGTFVGESITNNVVVSSWWLAGGAPAPVAAYQPKGAASLAASYINLAYPGTNDAAPWGGGVAPAWDSVNGWKLNGTTMALTTGITPTASYSVLCQFSDFASTGIKALFGTGTPGGGWQWLILPNISSKVDYLLGIIDNLKSPQLTSGNLGMAGATGYRNGVSEGALAGTPAITVETYIGAYNVLNTAQAMSAVYIQAFVIWSSTLTGAQMTAVAATMAAL